MRDFQSIDVARRHLRFVRADVPKAAASVARVSDSDTRDLVRPNPRISLR